MQKDVMVLRTTNYGLNPQESVDSNHLLSLLVGSKNSDILIMWDHTIQQKVPSIVTSYKNHPSRSDVWKEQAWTCPTSEWYFAVFMTLMAFMHFLPSRSQRPRASVRSIVAQQFTLRLGGDGPFSGVDGPSRRPS